MSDDDDDGDDLLIGSVVGRHTRAYGQETHTAGVSTRVCALDLVSGVRDS